MVPPGKAVTGGQGIRIGVSRLWSVSSRASAARVHECVFGVLALESEPVDPRL
ncbi:MAG: hypothetical protein HYX27_09100 [Acidobacteria bacterium]|nr:hypothetical protein [Acidobacteriota bacterium]